VVLVILVTLGTLVFGLLAVYPDEGASLKGIALSRDQFRLLMGGIAVLSVLLSWPLMVRMLIDSFQGTRRIAFTHDSVILPGPSRTGMSKDEVELPFDKILVVRLAPGRTCGCFATGWATAHGPSLSPTEPASKSPARDSRSPGKGIEPRDDLSRSR
jgi:hypothetical protein